MSDEAGLQCARAGTAVDCDRACADQCVVGAPPDPVDALLDLWRERARTSFHAHAWSDAVTELEEALGR